MIIIINTTHLARLLFSADWEGGECGYPRRFLEGQQFGQAQESQSQEEQVQQPGGQGQHQVCPQEEPFPPQVGRK